MGQTLILKKFEEILDCIDDVSGHEEALFQNYLGMSNPTFLSKAEFVVDENSMVGKLDIHQVEKQSIGPFVSFIIEEESCQSPWAINV